MREKREGPQGFETGSSFRLMGEEVTTIGDSDDFITRELKPFAISALGKHAIRRGQSVTRQFDGRADGVMNYSIAESVIIQTAAKSLNGLSYYLEITDVERLSPVELKASWPTIRQSINQHYNDLYDSDYFDDGSEPNDFDEVSLFERTTFNFMHGHMPTKEYYAGYLLVVLGDLEYFDIHTSTSDADNEYDDTVVKGSESLKILESQCVSQLTEEDINKVYRVLHMLGHLPEDEQRSAVALQPKDGHGKV